MKRLGALVAAGALLAPAGPAEAADRVSRTLKTRLPIVVVDTGKEVGNRDKVPATMRVIHRGRGRVNRLRHRPRYRGTIGIETRGATSAGAPKKQYSVETRKRSGENDNVSLLGLPKENDWVLGAAHDDRTFMRSVLAYRFSNAVGRYASRTRFVELVLNGGYQGIYVLAEKLKIDRRRVDVRAGGGVQPYLVERASNAKLKPWDDLFRLPVTSLPVLWTDPERDELEPQAAATIERELGDLDRAFASATPGDPATGYARLLDVPAAVDHVLVNELFKNVDDFHHSLYMHRGAGTKIRLGPVWDFDVSSGNAFAGPARAVPEGWATADYPWADELWGDPAFVRALAQRWRELRARGLPQRVPQWAARYARDLRAAAARDSRRWGIRGSLRTRTTLLRQWFRTRSTWMDDAFDRAVPPQRTAHDRQGDMK